MGSKIRKRCNESFDKKRTTALEFSIGAISKERRHGHSGWFGWDAQES
jgi:hypothetical protein